MISKEKYIKSLSDLKAEVYINGEKVDIKIIDGLKEITVNNKQNIYGLVLVKESGSVKVINDIDVQLNDANGLNVSKSITDKKGSFSFLNVSPGFYRIVLNEEQLKQLNYRVIPKLYEFERTDDLNEINEFNFILEKVKEK